MQQLRSRLGGLWLNSDFLKLWTGQTISELGSRITRDGLPLITVLLFGAGPAQMGVLAALGSAPVLIVGLFAGVWVDRMQRRPILIWVDILRGLLLLSIPAAAMLGVLHIEQLYVVTALVGGLTVIFSVAYVAYLPGLVERSHVLEGNSKRPSPIRWPKSSPGAGGRAGAGADCATGHLIDALTFFVSAGSLALVRKPEPVHTRAEVQQHHTARIHRRAAGRTGEFGAARAGVGGRHVELLREFLRYLVYSVCHSRGRLDPGGPGL
jgi:MFS family permease